MTEPNYRPRPATAPENAYRASNPARSRVTDSYRGITGSPLDNDLFDVKLDRRPKAIPLFDHIAEREIRLSEDKRKFFSPKQFQTIISNFDLSNINGTLTSTVYEFDPMNNRYYGNTFAKQGLESVFMFQSGLLSLPRSWNFDQSRIFLQIHTSDTNVANLAFNYMFTLYPDTALSTANRVAFKPEHLQFQLNGYCPLNIIQLQIRDISGPIVLPDPKMIFTVTTVGATTILTLIDHGLASSMRVFVEYTSNRKSTLPGMYDILAVTATTIEIDYDSTGLTYLAGVQLPLIVDDYIWNYNLKTFSIRRDEETSMPNIR